MQAKASTQVKDLLTRLNNAVKQRNTAREEALLAVQVHFAASALCCPKYLQWHRLVLNVVFVSCNQQSGNQWGTP